MGATAFSVLRNLLAVGFVAIGTVTATGCAADVGDEDEEEDTESLSEAEVSALSATGQKAFGLGVDAPVALADANYAKLKSSWKDGAYSLKTARTVFYIDLDADGKMDTTPLHTWANAVTAGGLEPVVGVSVLHRKGGWSGPKIDPVSRGFFRQQYAILLREFPSVKRWGIVNEPDLELADSSKERAEAAAIYYVDAKRTLAACQREGKCAKDELLVAGEFAYQGGNPQKSEAFWSAYGDKMLELVKTKKLASLPRVWAFHPYTDASAGNTDGTQRFSLFLGKLEKKAKMTPGALRIWITETGTLLRFADTCTSSAGNLNHQSQKQFEGGKTLYRLSKVGRVDRIYWWHYKQVAGHAWDSAMVDANGAPRPSFCGATKQAIGACTGVNYATQCK